MIALYQAALKKLEHLDFLPLLLLRIYLAPVFIKAGYGKLQLGNDEAGVFQKLLADPGIVSWFGNPDWGLGLPAPDFLAFMAGWTEFLGGWLLLLGLFTRLFSVALMFTMVIAAVTAHWEFGWHALPESKLTVPWEWRTDLIEEANVRKQAARSLLKRYGDYHWLTEAGAITVLKNGIEFAATYCLMLMVLLFAGAGRWFSLDYWFSRWRQG